MGLKTGDIVVYEELHQKFLTDLCLFCEDRCANVGVNMRIDDVLKRVSESSDINRCFDPRCTTLSNYVSGPVGNKGSKTAKLTNTNYRCYKRATGPKPHILAGSDVGFRNIYLIVDPSEADLLGKTYNKTDILGSFSRFLTELQPDLKGRIITTKDMIRFYCCLLTFVENKILRVCGGNILGAIAEPHMAYYFHDGPNDDISIRSVDTITATNFEDIGNVMDLLNTKNNTHFIKYNILEAKA